MGRLTTKPIIVPENVTVSVSNGVISVRGPKGELSRSLPKEILFVALENKNEVMFDIAKETKQSPALLGTTYVHTKNMVQGVSVGFTKILQLEGVGYRASMEGSDLVLLLGFSHPVRYTPPGGITVTTEKNEIYVSGINKEEVGEVAAKIRSYRPPEPYKGKGVRYKDEYIYRKAGKKAGVGA